jgi:hypothetical protein
MLNFEYMFFLYIKILLQEVFLNVSISNMNPNTQFYIICVTAGRQQLIAWMLHILILINNCLALQIIVSDSVILLLCHAVTMENIQYLNKMKSKLIKKKRYK